MLDPHTLLGGAVEMDLDFQLEELWDDDDDDDSYNEVL